MVMLVAYDGEEGGDEAVVGRLGTRGLGGVAGGEGDMWVGVNGDCGCGVGALQGEELGLTIPFEYTTYYAEVGQLSFSQPITCLSASSYLAPMYQSYQQLCLLVTIDASPSLLLLQLQVAFDLLRDALSTIFGLSELKESISTSSYTSVLISPSHRDSSEASDEDNIANFNPEEDEDGWGPEGGSLVGMSEDEGGEELLAPADPSAVPTDDPVPSS
ncbi:hypothetical protein Tco_1246259 [Tanacetum coccineum]